MLLSLTERCLFFKMLIKLKVVMSGGKVDEPICHFNKLSQIVNKILKNNKGSTGFKKTIAVCRSFHFVHNPITVLICLMYMLNNIS